MNTTATTILSQSDENLLQSSRITELEDENRRLKLGLGIGLGGGILVTGSIAAISYVYFSKRYINYFNQTSLLIFSFLF